jgi:hypothetical protein
MLCWRLRKGGYFSDCGETESMQFTNVVENGEKLWRASAILFGIEFKVWEKWFGCYCKNNKVMQSLSRMLCELYFVVLEGMGLGLRLHPLI